MVADCARIFGSTDPAIPGLPFVVAKPPTRETTVFDVDKGAVLAVGEVVMLLVKPGGLERQSPGDWRVEHDCMTKAVGQLVKMVTWLQRGSVPIFVRRPSSRWRLLYLNDGELAFEVAIERSQTLASSLRDGGSFAGLNPDDIEEATFLASRHFWR